MNTFLMAARRVSPRIHAIPAQKSSIVRFVEAVDTPVVLADREGRLTAMNAAARDFFIGRNGARLHEALETGARVAMADRRKSVDGSPNRARQFDINNERFQATFVVGGADLATQDIGAMIMLRRDRADVHGPEISEATLASRFGLTVQEARVAVMLADQLTNRDIAERLGVSVHTARHHTERVLAKLHIHSRHDVRKAIAWSGGRPTT